MSIVKDAAVSAPSPRWRRAVSLICAGLAIRMTVSASGAALL